MIYSDKQILFTPAVLKNITLPNRFIRSATYEGLADSNGVVSDNLADVYCELAKNEIGTIITGFCFVGQQGRAMQPAQAGINRDECIKPWSIAIEKVRKANPQTKIFMQLAHTGRQTLSNITGCKAVAPSSKKCTYFRQKVYTLSNSQIENIITEFADAAVRAQQAGFDGVQIHAAHGYLIHQFLSPDTNQRKDKWTDRNLFLVEVLKVVKGRCGEHFPILIKLSHSDDKALNVHHTVETIKRIEKYIDAVEISYGTMETVLNIFRGNCPVDTVLKVNPIFNKMPAFTRWLWKKFFLSHYLRKLKPFTENYNLDAAVKINQNTNVPVIPVGGIRSLSSMIDIIKDKQFAAVSLCRPLICQPAMVEYINENNWQKSKCINCNLCAIYCDTNHSLKCYGQEEFNGKEAV